MSCMRCDLCDAIIDTDYDVEGLWGVNNDTPNNEAFICRFCVETHELEPEE